MGDIIRHLWRRWSFQSPCFHQIPLCGLVTWIHVVYWVLVSPQSLQEDVIRCYSFPSWCCCAFTYNRSCKTSINFFQSSTMGDDLLPAVRCPYPACYNFDIPGTRQRVLDVCCVCACVLHRIWKYPPPTSGVSPFVPATMLGLLSNQDNCIVSPQSVNSCVK